MFVREIGVNGGEATSSGLLEPRGDSTCLDTCNITALWLLEGMEKLLGIINGGIGSGDAKFIGTEGILLRA